MQNSEQTHNIQERMDEETTFVAPSFILSHRSVRVYCQCHYSRDRNSCCRGWSSITVYQVIMSNEVIDELEEDALPRQLVNENSFDYMNDKLAELDPAETADDDWDLS